MLLRRAGSRFAESAALAVALALGAGAASAGASLLTAVLALKEEGLASTAQLELSLLIFVPSASCLLLAAFGAWQLRGRRALQTARSLAVLSALGASPGSLFASMLVEAAAFSLAGSLLGCLLALPLTRALEASIELPPGSPVLPILGAAASWLLLTAAAALQCRKLAREIPEEALRCL